MKAAAKLEACCWEMMRTSGYPLLHHWGMILSVWFLKLNCSHFLIQSLCFLFFLFLFNLFKKYHSFPTVSCQLVKTCGSSKYCTIFYLLLTLLSSLPGIPLGTEYKFSLFNKFFPPHFALFSLFSSFCFNSFNSL